MENNQSPTYIALSSLGNNETNELLKDHAKLIAFYLPQFHRIKENSEWWGDGFTEWTNVVQGKKNFEGHYQPHLPQYFGFYDLSNIEVIREQAEIAKLFGVHGFCFYHYWFSGRRILERPVEDFLKSDINMNFCLCWANENWTRTWDGDDKSVLMEQKYALGDDESFIASLIPYLKDGRYIKVDGKPLLLVYRAKELPEPKKSFKKWRTLAKDYGIEGLHICAVDFYDISDPAEVGADALVEFPPHKFNGPQNQPSEMPKFTNPKFLGSTLEYSKIIAQSMERERPEYKLYRGIIPSWDNTARRQDTPTIVVNSNPQLYGRWLAYLRAYTRKNLLQDDNFIFINAWNEWGEGCHLEPDLKWKAEYLRETYRSSFYTPEDTYLNNSAHKQVISLADYVSSSSTFEQSDLHDDMKNQISKDLRQYRSAGVAARKIGQRLRAYPRLHAAAKFIYTLLINLRPTKP